MRIRNANSHNFLIKLMLENRLQQASTKILTMDWTTFMGPRNSTNINSQVSLVPLIMLSHNHQIHKVWPNEAMFLTCHEQPIQSEITCTPRQQVIVVQKDYFGLPLVRERIEKGEAMCFH